MTAIILTVTKEEATAEEIDAVVLRLEKALPVERGMLGFLVGDVDQEFTRLSVNLVKKALTLSVRESHGETGVVIAIAIAKMLKQDVVSADGVALAPNAAIASKLLGRPLSKEATYLSEKIGLLLPTVKVAKVMVPF